MQKNQKNIIKNLLQQSGLDPSGLRLEITETMTLSGFNDIIDSLRAITSLEVTADPALAAGTLRLCGDDSVAEFDLEAQIAPLLPSIVEALTAAQTDV